MLAMVDLTVTVTEEKETMHNTFRKKIGGS
jgi:hypothetical protein